MAVVSGTKSIYRELVPNREVLKTSGDTGDTGDAGETC